MIELLPIKIESALDWSLILALLGGIVFYFGKLINEVSPYKEKKYSNYVNGTVYLVLFVIFPPLILYTIFEGITFIKINWIASLILQFLIAYYLGKRLRVFQLERVKLMDYVDKLIDQRTKEVYKKLNFKYSNPKWNKRVIEFFFYRKLPDYILLIFAIFNYWFTASIILSDMKIILSFLSLLLLFISISITAILYSWGHVRPYPKVTAHLENGKKLDGELTKIEEGFISLLDGNKIYHIIEDKVLYIEKDILKKK